MPFYFPLEGEKKNEVVKKEVDEAHLREMFERANLLLVGGLFSFIAHTSTPLSTPFSNTRAHIEVCRQSL